jgi:hypothetical protein
MKSKKKVLELLEKLGKWASKKKRDPEFEHTLKEIKDSVESEDDGSNPPGGPPSHKPPGGSGGSSNADE